MSREPAADAQTASPASAAVAFGVRLRSLRQRHGHTQQTLSGEIFYSREYVALVERGLRKPTATFVERAEIALHADGQLQQEFVRVQQTREQEVQQRAVTRRGQHCPRKIRSTVATLRAVHRDEIAAEPSALWLAAFDELHHVLTDKMEPHDAGDEITDLARRATDLAARAGATRWADVAVEAALGAAEAGTLLQRPLLGDHVARVRSIAGAFAAVVGDALMMLGQPVPADDWRRSADAVGDRRVPPPEWDPQNGNEPEAAVRPEEQSSRLVLHGRPPARAGRSTGVRNGRLRGGDRWCTGGTDGGGSATSCADPYGVPDLAPHKATIGSARPPPTPSGRSRGEQRGRSARGSPRGGRVAVPDPVKAVPPLRRAPRQRRSPAAVAVLDAPQTPPDRGSSSTAAPHGPSIGPDVKHKAGNTPFHTQKLLARHIRCWTARRYISPASSVYQPQLFRRYVRLCGDGDDHGGRATDLLTHPARKGVLLMRADIPHAHTTGSPPVGADATLWRHGAALAEQHRADPSGASAAPGCVDAACRTGALGPCWVRPLAQRLMLASGGSWAQRWTARHDARSCGLPVPNSLSAPTRVAGATAAEADGARRTRDLFCGAER